MRLGRRSSICLAYAGIIAATYTSPESAIAEESTQALELEGVYKGEFWQNLHGGLNVGGTYLDYLELAASLDAEKSMGLKNTSVRLSVLYNNRNTFSERYVGDTQVVSNIDTDGSLRLFELWVERGFASGAVKAGLIDLNSEFDINETGQLFLNSSHGIGPDFSQIGVNGPSIFPITGLGALARLYVNTRLQFRIGAFEGSPGDESHPRRTRLSIDDDEGYLWVGEFEFRPVDHSRLVLGLRRLSNRSGPTDDPTTVAPMAQFGGYGLIEGTLANFGTRSIDAFFRLGIADSDTHAIDRYLGTGLALSGPIFGSAKYDEQIGLALGIIRNSNRMQGEHVASSSPTLRREAAIELTYRIQALSCLAVQPNLQYILNPGTKPDSDNALVLGLRLEFAWGM